MSATGYRARDYTLGGVIESITQKKLDDVHTACVGRITKYDATTQKAEVQPIVKITYLDEAGDPQTETMPLLVNVPVIFPGGGGFRVTFPIKADADTGDTALVVFSEQSLDVWLSKGGNTIDPLDDRRCHLSDAVCFVGLRDFSNALTSARADAMTLGDDVGLQIHIDKQHVQIGTKDPAQLEAAALGDTAQTIIDAVCSFLASHTHSVVTGGPGGTVTSAPATGAPTSTNIKSSKVQVAK